MFSQIACKTKRLRAVPVACASSIFFLVAPLIGFAAPYVEFDVAPIAECRDITPPERIAQYPNQRLIEVALPVSVRFRGVSMNDVEELAIEINGTSAGLHVDDFAPATQLVSDITHEIETTTTSSKKRSLDGSLGGTLPVPGVSDAMAHLTPSISAGLSDCDTETEKINRLPPKHAVVVSGTLAEGRGVFFKLKRYSQTSLEGEHELAVTFVAPRAWQRREIQVDCSARGQRKMLWMKQPATVGQASRMVQLVQMSAKPTRQVVLKPVPSEKPVAKSEQPEQKTATATAGRWRPALKSTMSAELAEHRGDQAASKPATALKADARTTADE